MRPLWALHVASHRNPPGCVVLIILFCWDSGRWSDLLKTEDNVAKVGFNSHLTVPLLMAVYQPAFSYHVGLATPAGVRTKNRKWSRSVVSDSLRPHGLQPTTLLRPWDFPGKNTGVGCHFLLQGIFPTQGLNPGLPHCRQTLYKQT